MATINDPAPERTALPRVSFTWDPITTDPVEVPSALDLPWGAGEPAQWVPQVTIGASPVQPAIYYTNANVELTFTASVTLARGDYITAYVWNFGDGGTGYGPEAKHTYTNAGSSIRASVCVTDNHRRRVCTGRQVILTPADFLNFGDGFVTN